MLASASRGEAASWQEAGAGGEGWARVAEEVEAGDEDSRRDEEGLEGKWVAILATTKQ